MSKKDFGVWMSALAKTADAATNETLEGIKKKLQAEKQARLEAALRKIFEQMEDRVCTLSTIRRQGDVVKAQIKELEKQANDLVTGNAEPVQLPYPPTKGYR